MLQQSFGAVRGSHRHRVIARNLPHRSILGLEASGRIGGRPERPGLLEPPLPAPRQLIVMLELPGVVLVHPKRCRRLRLHVLRRHRDRFVRPGVVGFRGFVHMLRPPAAVPGHLARQVLLQSLNRSIYDRRCVAVRRVLLAVHHALRQRFFEPSKLVAQVCGNDVVALFLHQSRDDLRRRCRDGLRPLVGQGLGGHLPREHVRDHQAEFVAPSRVLAEVHQVRLEPVVRPLRRTLPQAPWLGRQHLPGHVASQGCLGPGRGQVPPVRELSPRDLIKLPRVPHIEVPGQPPEKLPSLRPLPFVEGTAFASKTPAKPLVF